MPLNPHICLQSNSMKSPIQQPEDSSNYPRRALQRPDRHDLVPKSSATSDGDTDSKQAHITYPVHFLDGLKPNWERVAWLSTFNDVLDAEKLRDSLTRLLEMEGWKRLGGRVKRKHDGQLEIHVPLHYTEQNTAICFTHDTQNADINVTDHPLGSQLPHPTNGPSTHALGPGALFRQFMVPPDYPPTFDAFIAQDRPLINLHVTTFRDATTVGVAWPHITMDAAAYGQMLRAWSLVLAGRESEVPPVFDLRRDALQEMEEAAAKEFKPEPLVHGQPELTGWRFIYLLAISYWGILFGPAMQKRAIFIPRATCDRFVRSVKAGVASIPVTATPGGGGDSTSNWFVGENDILIAWIARIIQLSQSASRPVTVAAIASVSHRLAPVLEMAGAGHVFLQNMLTMTRYHLPAAGAAVRSNQDQEQDYVQQGLPANALRIKLQNAEQTHPGNITSNTAQVRKRGRSKLQLYGAKNAIVLLVNPLSKLDLITAADFAPAVVRQGEASETRTNPLGTALFKYNTGVTKVNDGLNIFFTLGQTHRGDRWLQGNFTERTWRLLESELAKMEGRQT